MYLGLDLGTGSVKAALYADGRLLREASAPYLVLAPHAGWAETDPDVWWASTVRAAHEAIGPDGGAVRAVGLSGQMHGVVLCGPSGRVVRPAVLWADARAMQELRAYHALPEGARRALRNPITVGMAGPTLLWLRDHEPAAYREAVLALQPKDWLRLHLTGEAHAEPSDASGTLLYDLTRDDWNRALAGDLGLNAALLAPLVPSGAPAGALRSDVARELGLPPHLPVAAGGADTACALLGTGLPSGQVQLTVGSGAQLVIRHDALPDARAALHVFRDTRARGWYTLAAVQNAGLALEWARRALRLSWEEFYALAQDAPAGALGLVFLPHLTGERTPHMDPRARGGWVNAGLEHDARHLARAAFEGVALGIAEAASVLPDTHGRTVRLAGGGSLHPWWRQLLTDALARPLAPVDAPAASVLGAATLAARAVGEPPPAAPAPARATLIEPRPDGIPPDTRAAFSAAYVALRRQREGSGGA